VSHGNNLRLFRQEKASQRLSNILFESLWLACTVTGHIKQRASHPTAMCLYPSLVITPLSSIANGDKNEDTIPKMVEFSY